jgi:catechol 2,3-dioxygenase-like lactoylglutathione lyase family enzyme
LRTLGVFHFSFTVSDLDAAIVFYRDQLGLTFVHRQVQDNDYTRRLVGYPDARIEVAQFTVPGERRGLSLHDIELVWYERPVGQRVANPEIKNPGEAHLAIAVDDADAWYERLSENGIRFFSPPNEITAGVNTGGKSCYFYGPDDIVHEILQPPAHRIEAFLASESDASSEPGDEGAAS